MKKKILLLVMCFLLICIPFLTACNETIYDHQIFVTSSDIRLGSVNGDGVYKTNSTVKLSATEKNDKNKFVCWIKDNEIMSTEINYEFIASKNTEGKYTAVFYSENSNFLALEKFQVIATSTNSSTTFELSEIMINLSNREIYSNNEMGILFASEENQSQEFQNEFTTETKYVFNKDVEIGTTITTKINNSVTISNFIFLLNDENLLQVSLQPILNLSDITLQIKLFFKPLGTPVKQ